MSKSLGNYEPFADLWNATIHKRFGFAAADEYAKVKNFTDDSVAGAAVACAPIEKAYRALHAAGPPATTDLKQTGYVQRVEAELDEDMNTAAALAALLEFAGDAARWRSGPVPARRSTSSHISRRCSGSAERNVVGGAGSGHPRRFRRTSRRATRRAFRRRRGGIRDRARHRHAARRARSEGLGCLRPSARCAAGMRRRADRYQRRHDVERRRRVGGGRPSSTSTTSFTVFTRRSNR